MDKLLSLFMISRIIILLGIPALFSVTAIYKVISFRKKNGDVIYKKGKISFFFLMMFILGSIVFLFILDEENIIISSAIYLVAVALFFGSYLQVFIEFLELGIYSTGVVFPGYTADWEEIEGYINMYPVIRFIHQDKGAFDIRIALENFEKCVGQISKYSVEIE